MLTSVQQRGGGVLVGAVGPGARPVGGAAVGIEVDHEIRLLPAVFLQRPAQLFVGPDQLQHLAGAAHLSVRALAVLTRDKGEEVSCRHGWSQDSSWISCCNSAEARVIQRACGTNILLIHPSVNPSVSLHFGNNCLT